MDRGTNLLIVFIDFNFFLTIEFGMTPGRKKND